MSPIFRDPYLLKVEHVTKRYGELVAVNDVSLNLAPGEVLALLGPNGAGKTTLIGCICGMITRFEGKVSVAGYSVRDDYRITRRLIGLVPQELNYDSAFTVREVLEFQGGYYAAPPSRERVDELLEQFSLTDKANSNTRWLSGGMKRRLMICKALLHDPVLLFLDEPTAGVDVDLREELWEYVRGLREQGTSIVLTTHYIEEAEALADRVGIINHGNLLRIAPRERLMEELGRRTVEIRLEQPVPQTFLEDENLRNLALTQTDPFTLQLVVDTPRGSEHQKNRHQTSAPNGSNEAHGSPIDRVLRHLFTAGLSIAQVEGGRTSLEEIFREIIHNDSSAAANPGNAKNSGNAKNKEAR